MNSNEARSEAKSRISARGRHILTICSTGAVLLGTLGASIFYSHCLVQSKIDARLGFELLAQGKVDDAISHFQKAVGSDREAICKITRINYRDSPEETLAKAALQLKIRPDNESAFEDQARAYESLNQLEKAESSYRKAIALKMGEYTPGSNAYQRYDDLAVQFAQLLLKEGKKTEAVKFVERSRPVLFFNNDFKSVCKELKLPYRAFGEDADWEEIEEALNKAERDSYDSEQLPVVRKEVDAVINKYPSCNQALLMKAKINIESQPDTAIACANQVLAKYPGLAESLHIRAKAYCVKKDYSKAIQDFGAALKQLPNTQKYYLEMSDAHLASGLWKEALNDLDKAEGIAKPDTDVAEKRVEILKCIGRRYAAFREISTYLKYQRLVDLDSKWFKSPGDSDNFDSVTVWNALSDQITLLIADGKLDEAQKIIEVASTNQFKDYTLPLAKSKICLLRNDNAGALAAAMEAKSLESEDAKQSDQSLMQLATVHTAMENAELAKRELESALKIVNDRLHDVEEDCSCSNNDYFERALISIRLGSRQEDVRRDVGHALKEKETTVLEVGSFVSSVKALKRSESTNTVVREILSVHPEWKSLVDKWLKS